MEENRSLWQEESLPDFPVLEDVYKRQPSAFKLYAINF